MYSELECGICYQTYNAGWRCPRELHCKHSFCESCLLLLSGPLGSGEAPLGADRLIVCPLCRQTTCISAGRKMRAELRVDECVLERLLTAGVNQEDEEDKDREEEGDGQVQDSCEDGEQESSPAEESDSSAVTRGGALRRSWRKVWRKIRGNGARGGESK